MKQKPKIIAECGLCCQTNGAMLRFSCDENGRFEVTLPEEIARQACISSFGLDPEEVYTICKLADKPGGLPEGVIVPLFNPYGAAISLHYSGMFCGIQFRIAWIDLDSKFKHPRQLLLPLYRDQLQPLKELAKKATSITAQPVFGL